MKIKIEIRNTFDNPNSRIIATGNILIDECFVVKNAKLMDNRNGKGLYVAMPHYRAESLGIRRDVCHPITKECRQQIETAFIDAYNETIAAELESADEDE